MENSDRKFKQKSEKIKDEKRLNMSDPLCLLLIFEFTYFVVDFRFHKIE
jgi:hypothetical protein